MADQESSSPASVRGVSSGDEARRHAAYNVVKDALVELPLGRAALPQLVVAVVEAFPVLAELGEAMCVDVLDAFGPESLSARGTNWEG